MHGIIARFDEIMYIRFQVMTTAYIVKVLRNSTYSPQCWQESRTTRRKAETMNRARVFMFRFGEEFISLIVLAAQLRIRPPFCSLTRLLVFQCSYSGAVVSQSQPTPRGAPLPNAASVISHGGLTSALVGALYHGN